MVNAYLHLQDPIPFEKILTFFDPDDEIHIQPVYENSCLLGSPAISPSRLKFILQSCLSDSNYAIMILKTDKSFDVFTGRPRKSAQSSAPAFELDDHP